MKQKLLTIKSLLVAVLLLGGANFAWATRTITYDFATAEASGGIAESTLTNSSNSAGTNNSTAIYYPSELTDVLQNRFAFQYREKSNNTNAWSINKSRGGLWSNCASGVDDYFSIMNLKAGDVVTITIASGEIYFSTEANATYDDGGTPTTPAQWASLSSGTAYTIKANGKLDLQAKKYQNGVRGHLVISSIVIVTSDDETIDTAPSVVVTGANGGAREITITSFNTSADNGTTAYYTLDGTTPTASSTEYSAAFNISDADDTDADGIVVVKAISCKTGETSIASSVTTLNVPVGTPVSLIAPDITLTAFTANGGVFNPTYSFTSDQSSVIGTPAATLTYSFNGGAATAGTSYTPTATGTLRVTASADGYTSTYTDLNVTCAEFLKTYVFDATKDISVNDGAPTTYDPYSINSTGCRLYALSNCTFTTSKSISFDNNMQFAWAKTADKAYCLFARTNKSTISYNLNDGEYIEFTNFGTPVIAYSATTSTQLAWYSSVRQINVYTPANYTVSKAITSAGWATYCSPYALDLEHATGLTDAYIVTDGDAGVLSKTSVKGGTVPANTGLLLKGDAGTATIPVVASSSTNVSANKLEGVTVNTEIAAEAGYVLMNDATYGLGFYKNSNAFTVGANTAYLPANFANAPALFYSLFDNETTGINEVQGSGLKVNGYYNLNGQRVAQPTKGLYIVNGHKVVIK